MGDFANRADWESKLQHALEKLQKAQMRRLVEALGDPPDLNKVEPSFWNEFSTEYRETLYPILEGVFLDGAGQYADEISIGVEWDLVNEAAARWARQYTFDLVTDITDRTRNALREKVGGYFETPTAIGDLQESLANLFGPRRAEAIALTEVTRAAVEGQRQTAQEVQKEGVQIVAVWQTNNDDIVCVICGPRNQKREGEGWTDPPPAHPRCRCWVNYEFVEPA